jgi:hypothetical protein
MKNYVDLDKMVTKKKNTYMSTETRIIDEKIKNTGALAGSAMDALKKVNKPTQQIIGLVLVATVLKHLCEATVISSYSQFMEIVMLDILTILPNWITEENLKKSMEWQCLRLGIVGEWAKNLYCHQSIHRRNKWQQF